MNIFFLDVSGERKWEQFHDALDLLYSPVIPRMHDLVFIHGTDVLAAQRHSGNGIPDGIPDDKWKSFSDILASLAREARIGDGRATVICLSGAPRFLERDQRTLRDLLREHEQDRIHFAPNIPHKIGPDKLEEHFGECIVRLASTAEGVFAPQATFEISNESLELITAFRFLWQTFVLANTDTARVPDTLKELKKRLGHFTFGRDYWMPLLNKEGRLDERLARVAEKDLRDVFVALGRETNWDRLSADEVVRQYREKWFTTFIAARSNKP